MHHASSAQPLTVAFRDAREHEIVMHRNSLKCGEDRNRKAVGKRITCYVWGILNIWSNVDITNVGHGKKESL